jgi:hypothetical protein
VEDIAGGDARQEPGEEAALVELVGGVAARLVERSDTHGNFSMKRATGVADVGEAGVGDFF